MQLKRITLACAAAFAAARRGAPCPALMLPGAAEDAGIRGVSGFARRIDAGGSTFASAGGADPTGYGIGMIHTS